MVEKSCCFFCRSPVLARHRGAFEYHEPARRQGTEHPGGREFIGDSCAHRAVQPSEHPSCHLQNHRFVGVPTAFCFYIGATRVILRRWSGDENYLQPQQALTSSLSSSSGRGPMEGHKDFCLPPAAGGGPSHWNEMVAILFAPAELGLVEKKVVDHFMQQTRGGGARLLNKAGGGGGISAWQPGYLYVLLA